MRAGNDAALTQKTKEYKREYIVNGKFMTDKISVFR